MNNEISLQQAIDMTSLFRAQKHYVVNPELAGKHILPTCETFDRAIFDKILSQPGCLKLRIYLGLNSDLQVRCIVVGVNDQDEDMLPPSTKTLTAASATDTSTIGEDGQSCPPLCPPPSPLNSNP